MNNKSDLRIPYDPTTECASYLRQRETAGVEFGFGADWLDTAARRTRPLGSYVELSGLEINKIKFHNEWQCQKH